LTFTNVLVGNKGILLDNDLGTQYPVAAPIFSLTIGIAVGNCPANTCLGIGRETAIARDHGD